MRLGLMVGVLALGSAAGCGSDGPEMHTVRGRVTLAGGDLAQLAGHSVEAVREGDPTLRASAIINAEGRFELETLHAGVVHKGAREGKYLVRIVAADGDEQGRKRSRPPVAPRYLKFETSRLRLEVPTREEVTLPLAAR